MIYYAGYKLNDEGREFQQGSSGSLQDAYWKVKDLSQQASNKGAVYQVCSLDKTGQPKSLVVSVCNGIPQWAASYGTDNTAS